MNGSPSGGAARWAGLLLLAPLAAGLAAAVCLVLPPLAPLVLPLAAARLGRRLLGAGPAVALGGAALVVPAAGAIGLLVPPLGAWLTPVVAVTAVALPALAVAVAGRDGRRTDEVALVASASVAVGLMSVLLGAGLGTGHDPGALLSARLGRSLPQVFDFYRSAGLGDASIASLAEFFEVLRTILGRQVVGLSLGAAFLYGAVVVYPLGGRIGLTEPAVSERPFSRFRTPLLASVAFVPLGLLAALGPREAARTAVDVLIPLGVLFFLRGLAIIRALLERGAVGLLGRSLVYLLVVQMPFPAVVALGGLFDEFFDFRARFAAPPGGAAGGMD